MGPLKIIYSIPLEKLIEHGIMKDDLPKGEENETHYYIEEKDKIGFKGVVGLEIGVEIGQFLKLFQRLVATSKVLYELLINYSQTQILTCDQHLQSIQNKEENQVVQIRVEKAKQLKLTKVKRAIERALKEVAKTKKATYKEIRELTHHKSEEDDRGGQMERILQLIKGGILYSRDSNHGRDKSFVWQPKVNQRIAKAKFTAKKGSEGYMFQHFPPLLEKPWFYGYKDT